MAGVVYENIDLTGKDFSNQDLSNVKFVLCDFDDTLFVNANLTNAQFIRCTAKGPIMFEGANMSGCTIKSSSFCNSKFNKANLSRSHIVASNFSKSSLMMCDFSEAVIDNLNVAQCNLHLSSFVNAQISSLKYLPLRPMPYLRGLRLFKSADIQQNTIFINGNKHLDFAEYCNSELKKEKLFVSVNKSHPILHPFAILFLLLFGLLTNFGQSFTRWAVCTVGIVVFFSLLPVLMGDGVFVETIKDSTIAFFGMEIKNNSWLYISESIVGYFMLGALISLLTSKLSID